MLNTDAPDKIAHAVRPFRRPARFIRMASVAICLAVSSVSSAAPGSAIARFLPTVREAAPGLPNFTVYRPADLTAVGGPVPVLLWANGACKTSNQQYWDVLSGIAARGFVIVAVGAAEDMNVQGGTVIPARLTPALDWVTTRARNVRGYERVDPTRIGVFGTSCGGLEALLAGEDARVKAVAGLNTGFFNAGTSASQSMGGFSPQEVTKLHTPTLFVGGGPSDVAYPQTHSNYDASTVKTVLAENPDGGHSGLWAGLRYTLAPDGKTATGSTVDYSITIESIGVVVRWFDFVLNGNAAEGSYFLGAQCGLCQLKGWSVRSKGF